MPELVPNYVVLLAPGLLARAVGQLVVVLHLGFLLPSGSHLLGLGIVLAVNVALAHHLGYLGIACNAHDGLDGEVAVACPVTCEVVGTELVGGVQAVLHEEENSRFLRLSWVQSVFRKLGSRGAETDPWLASATKVKTFPAKKTFLSVAE